MKRFIPLTLMLLLGSLAKAQPYMGLHFIGASPLNELCDSTYRHGFGFGMEFMSNNLLRNTINPNALDFRIGGNFEFLAHGKESREITLNTPSNDPGDYSVRNNHFGLLLMGRFTFLGQSKVSPYIDGFVGPRFFNTTETIAPQREIPGFEPNETNIYNTSTFHYGASFGLLFNLNRTFAIDTRVTYSDGTEANWAVLNDVNLDGNYLKYPSTKTFTDLFIYRVGFTIRFNKSDNTKSSSPTRTSSPRSKPATTPVKPKGGTTVTPKPAPAPSPSTPTPTPAPQPVEPKPSPKPLPPPPKPQH